ncbi:MAG: DUF4062 domain-containing protein, partial [Acidobacteria bacterium]|nr:DUF4062 domain-containing protein [Acidobacteriota bacterium]
MPSHIVRVFVSSTWQDLEPERGAVESALQRMREIKLVGMEDFGSRAETTHRASLDEVKECDVYVGIFGARYGSGITEAEYRRARALRLPCHIYIKSDATITDDGRESDPAQTAKLDALKGELRRAHTIGPDFINPQDLAAKVTADLHRWLADTHPTRKLQGALGGDSVTGDKIGDSVGGDKIGGDSVARDKVTN